MHPIRRLAWFLVITAAVAGPVLLLASINGTPLGRTGAFGEPGCDGFGCHRNEPLAPSAAGRVVVDVGPYFPGQTQRVQIQIIDIGARRFGFQLAARERRNPQQQAGSFFAGADDVNVRVRCANGSEPPCASGLQYVTHTSVGTSVFRFAINWTAPSTDVGEVVFTIAAVGADGDNGTNGDHFFTAQYSSFSAPGSQPALREGGIVSAASFQAPGGAISRGALVSLFGERLAPAGFTRTVTRDDLTTDGKLPIELSRIGADFVLPPGDPIPAYVLYVSDGQINIQVPELPPLGPSGRISVQPVFNRGRGTSEIRGNQVTVTVLPVVPALFTFDGRSVAAVHSAIPAGAPVGRAGQLPNSRPARPGDIILVFGTGFGATQPPVEAGALAPGAAPLVSSFGARIGGLTLSPSDILYAGAAPNFAGLQQFNLRIPAGVGSGDLPIVCTAAGLETQPGVTVRVEP